MLRAFETAAAFVLLYIGIFMYEPEEKGLQNRLQDAWIKIDETADRSVSRHTAFFRVTTDRVLALITCIFGHSLRSLQAIGVSACLSLGTLAIIASAAGPLIDAVDMEKWPHVGWYVMIATSDACDLPVVIRLSAEGRFLLGLAFVIVALLPVASRRFRWLPFVATVTYIVFFVRGGLFRETGTTNTAALENAAYAAFYLFVIVVSIGCDFAFLVLLRNWLRRVSIGTALQIGSAAVALLLIASLFSVGLLASHTGERHYSFQKPIWESDWISSQEAGAIIAASNLLSLVLASLYFIVAASLLLHRLVWGAIKRPIYAAHRFGVVHRRGWLATIGLTLLAHAWVPFQKPLQWLLSTLLK